LTDILSLYRSTILSDLQFEFFGRLTYVLQKVGEAFAFDAVAMHFYGAEKADSF